MPNTLAHEYFWENCKKKMIMDYEKEIPFGAFDSELIHEEISIPEGFEAVIEGNKIILTKTESEDERIRKILINLVKNNGTSYYIDKIHKDDILAWLERQGEQKLPMEKLTSEMKTIGESLGFTTQEECDKYNQMVSDLIMSNADKVEPKFKVGYWIVNNISKDIFLIKSVNSRYCTLEDTKGNIYSPCLPFESDFHLWTIQDAKEGDVLMSRSPFIYGKQCPYGGLNWSNNNFIKASNFIFTDSPVHPATKEQRDLLFQKMKEAGYEWDAENLQLTKILPVKKLSDGINIDRQKTAEWSEDAEKKKLGKIEDEEYNNEDYGIDGLWHAQRILEKTIGKVEGYQTDDGILDHKAAITAVKKLYKQKTSEWSEEDETEFTNTIIMLKEGASLHFNKRDITKAVDWLKSLKDRYTWKPSKEQMDALNNARWNAPFSIEILDSLYNDLKKLKGE